MKNTWPITARGRLSADEKRAIEEYANSTKKPRVCTIARQLGRDASTISWHMMTHGFIGRRLKYLRELPYLRKGKKVYPWLPEHDAVIERLRVEGLHRDKIAASVTKEFGIERGAHSVEVRLQILAAYDSP